MSLTVNLFVHGVPKGQRTWGPKGSDERYIQSFYGPNWDAPELMKVDIMTFGGSTYCYYTFVKGQNVCAFDGRAGAYFALTVRVNAYYADVQNMYNLLKAIYDKMCVGLCVQESNGAVRFILSEFDSIDAKLKEIEKHLLSYISAFSVGNDIVSLAGFPQIAQSAIFRVNLHECTRQYGMDAMRQSGKLIVSPWYLSASAMQKIAQCEANVQATKANAQQEILRERAVCQEKLKATEAQKEDAVRQVRESMQQQIAQERKAHSDEIQNIQARYANFNARERELKDHLREADSRCRMLEASIREKDMALRAKDKEIEKKTNKILQLEQPTMSEHYLGESENSGNWIDCAKDFLGANKEYVWAAVAIVCTLFILFVGIFGYFYICAHAKEKVDVVEEPSKLRVSGRRESAKVASLRIVIEGLEDTDSARIGQKYKVRIENPGDDLERCRLESNEFEINTDDRISPKEEYAGQTGMIKYVLDGETLDSIAVKIAKL